MRSKLLSKIFALMLVGILAGSQVGYAAELEPDGTRWRKAQRGFLNVALSPFEVAHSVHRCCNDRAVPNWFFALARGIYRMSGRALVGVYELLTFPIDLPAEEHEYLIHPEFAWELFNETEN